ncbi:hypothetical protein C8T65DRAFT_782804, partial [Cerioporus squamosus]
LPEHLELCDGLAALGKQYRATATPSPGGQYHPIFRPTRIRASLPRIVTPHARRDPDYHAQRLKQNLAVLTIELSPEDVERVGKIATPPDATQGKRHLADVLQLIFVGTPPLRE